MGRPGLTRHRKFLRLSRILEDAVPGFGAIVARGALELLWDACYESGDSYLGDADDVEALAGWRGRRGVLCQALVEAGGDGHSGFIEESVEGRYQLHDLLDHAPDYVRKRRQRELERRTSGAAIRSMDGQGPVNDRSPTGRGLDGDGSTAALPARTQPAPIPHASQPTPSPAEPDWLAGVRKELATRFGLPRLSIGKDQAFVVQAFRMYREELEAEGHPDPVNAILLDCLEIAKRSNNGVPTSLSFFVGWFERAPRREGFKA